MKKSPLLLAAALGCFLAVPLIGYELMTNQPAAGARGLNTIEPTAGETTDVVATPVTAAPAATPQTETLPPRLIPAETTSSDIVPAMHDQMATDTALTRQDSEETPPLRITSDKAEVIQLDRDAVNILVGSDKNLRVVPDTNRTLILIPKQPGSTYFKALDSEGKIIMQRHVIVGSPKNEYIRIRRACVNGADGCKEYSVYYCPDMCHEVSVSQDEKKSSPSVPDEAPNYRESKKDEPQGNQQDDSPPPDTLEQ